MSSLTSRLAEFAAGMHAASVPPAMQRIVTTGVTDLIASMLAGCDEPVVGIVRRACIPHTVWPTTAGGGARVLLGREHAAPQACALVNATAAHALDYDDVAMAAHPSAVLVPALLATAESLDSPGAYLIAAYVAGYEVWAELCSRDADQHHGKGWHPTSVFGTVAAAAACAALRGLDTASSRHAIGIAASMAGGLVANFGTMTKPLHAGRAAEAGVLAALLAADGLTASRDAIEHPLGFLAAISPSGRVDRERPCRLGEDWQLPRLGLNVKKYPTCYSTHRSLDAMIALRDEFGFGADEVEAVEVEMGATQAAILRNARPQTGLDAKFSEEFAMAAAVIRGRAGLAELSDDFVRRADIQSFLPRVAVRTTELRDPEDPVFSPTETVRVRLRDGRTLEREVRHARGHACVPLSHEELWAKFSDCLATVATPEAARELFDQLQRLGELESVRALPTISGSRHAGRGTSSRAIPTRGIVS